MRYSYCGPGTDRPGTEQFRDVGGSFLEPLRFRLLLLRPLEGILGAAQPPTFLCRDAGEVSSGETPWVDLCEIKTNHEVHSPTLINNGIDDETRAHLIRGDCCDVGVRFPLND